MIRSEKKIVRKLSIVVVCTVMLYVLFSVPLLSYIAPLGNILFPGSGLWRVPGEVPESETLYIEGLTDKVTIYRDEWGIPHIYAANEDDMAFAMGYIHAQDRMFQMDMARRQVRGKLAEILGQKYLESDKYNLAIGMEYWAEKTLNNAIEKQETGEIDFLDSAYRYIDGINFYIDTHQHEYPIEYAILGIRPTHFSLLDSFCFAKYMSKMLTWDYDDLYRLILYQALGNESYNELFNVITPYQIPICPNYGSFIGNESIISEFTKSGFGAPPKGSSIIHSVSQFLSKVQGIESERHIIDSRKSGVIGSNNWVVDGNKSSTGKPILCNDMHLEWMLPGIWYEAHLVTEDPELGVYGFTLAGEPLPIVGHNDYLAWGLTNTGFDVMDWYYYTEIDNNNYIYDGVITPYTKRTYKINVRGQSPVDFTVKETVHGPVLNDLLSDDEIPPLLEGSNIILAPNWTGNRVDDMFSAIYELNHAKNRTDFNEASKKFSSPAQNIIYADIYGNIGIRPTGLVPIRENNGTFPYNGSNGKGNWNDFIPFEELPHTENPSQHYLASANQISVGPNYTKYFLQNDYASGYRARRINELLNNSIDGTVGIEIMKEIQLDIKSVPAQVFTPYLINATENYSEKNSTINDILTQLKNWDYDMDKDLSAPTIYRVWRDRLMNYTFNDEFNEVANLKPRLNVLEKLMKNKTSIWFDDANTGSTEDRDDIIIKALLSTIGACNSFYGTQDVIEWRWGDMHEIYVAHITKLKAFSKGPFEADGERYTINPSYANIENINDVKYATHGASERMIIDLSDIKNSYSVIPSGQRGLSNSKHYSDQLEELFLQGKYHRQYFYSTPSEFPKEYIESQLILLPAEEGGEWIIFLTAFIVIGLSAGIVSILVVRRHLSKKPSKEKGKKFNRGD